MLATDDHSYADGRRSYRWLAGGNVKDYGSRGRARRPR